MAVAPELIPEAVEVADALPLLGPLAAFLFIVGCIYVVDAFVRALFGTVSGAVGWIPYLNKVAATPVHKIEQKVTSALGSAERYFDHRIGMSLHKLARIGDKIGRELYGLATLTLTLAHFAFGTPTMKDLLDIYRKARKEIAAVERLGQHALHRIGATEHTVARAVNTNVLPRVGRIEHEIDHVLEPDIAALRKRVVKLEDGAIDAFRWIRAHPLSLGATAFAGAVAVALQRLGGSWIRCRNWNRIGKHVCGLPASLIEDLLGLSLAFLAVVDPVVIAEAAIKTEDTIHSLVVGIAEMNPERG